MLQISKIKAISLDLDDTLWPIWPTIARAEVALAQWLAPRAPLAAAVLSDLTTRVALRERVLQERPDLGHNMSAIRLQMIQQALAQGGEDPGLAPDAFEVFFAERMRVDCFEDVLPGLAHLAQHYPLFALSNGNADVQRVGLGAYFSGSISAHEFGVGKPDAKIFHAAAAQAGCAPQEMLHVGDDALLDVLGALGAGQQSVWMNRTGQTWAHEARPHGTVTTLHALCDLLTAAQPV